MPRLLVIDDRDTTVEMCHRKLGRFDYVTRCGRNVPCQVCEERDRGCPYKCAHDYHEAAETLQSLSALPDLVVLDLHFALPEERLLPEDKSDLPRAGDKRRHALEHLRRHQGLLILERLRRDYPTLPVVLLTTTDAEPRGQQLQVGDPLVYFCENEIVDSRMLAAEITRALELHHATQEGPIFWGRSARMAELRRTLGTLSRSPLPVLLEGETGTGKSFLAEHVIHPRSGAKGPLVVTDLSTVPPSLLPAHLFGARRGSYTGSIEDTAGVFEQAHGGTLFLDEIANLDLDTQRQLLLVLERGQVTRLGEVKARPAMAKLVAATNQDLGELVRAGRFRADLYMRLNPATRLRVPSLRERREDLPELLRFALLGALRSEALRPLVRAFLARFPTPSDFREERSAVVIGRPTVRQARPDAFTVFVGRGALGAIKEHAFPGNLRELKMLAMNALVFTLVELLESEGGEVADPSAATASAGSATSSASRSTGGPRALALLPISDALVERLLAQPGAEPARPERPTAGAGARMDAAAGRASDAVARVEVEVRRGESFARISTAVERQYLRAIFEASGGDLDRMAEALFGPGATGRKVHLRMNQLGLRLRELRSAT